MPTLHVHGVYRHDCAVSLNNVGDENNAETGTTSTIRRRIIAATSAGLATVGFPTARAQAWPGKPIHVVVPYSAGGGADANARLMAMPMSASLGQQVIVDNRPGASGVIGVQTVVNAPADGYTVLFDSFPFAVNAVLRKLPFDPVHDLIPVSQAINVPNILVVPESAPYTTLEGLIDYAKAHPGKLDYASYGAGGSAHLAAELLKRDAGIDWVHVPYKGGAPAIADLLAGQVSAYFAHPVSSLGSIRAGKLRALATTGDHRMAVLPDVPTMIECGFPGFEVSEWTGFFVVKGTPPAIIDRLVVAMREAAHDPQVHERMLSLGIEPVGSTPAEFKVFVDGQMDRWSALVRANHITLE